MNFTSPIDSAVLLRIDSELDALLSVEGIRPLLAVESGSRAWGFPSTDSDYDVRFLYLRPLDWYLSVAERPDTLSKPITDDMDLSGWDMRKVLRLLGGSNMALFEWFSSPIVYRQDQDAVSRLRDMMPDFFQPRAALHHYLGMTRKYWMAMADADTVRLKHYCYTLRTSLCCRWIIERESAPPMDLPSLRTLIEHDPSLKETIDALIAEKAVADESAVVARNPLLHTAIGEMVDKAGMRGSDIEQRSVDLARLDDFFRMLLSPSP